MWSTINIILAILTVGLAIWNLTVMRNDIEDKKKFKIFIDSKFVQVDVQQFVSMGEDKYLSLLLNNVGDNTLISADIEIPDKTKVLDEQRIGTLRPSYSHTIYLPIQDIPTNQILSEKNKLEHKVPLKFSYYNKYYDTYLIENKKLNVTIQKSKYDPSKVIIKTDYLYIESRKYKSYRSE